MQYAKNKPCRRSHVKLSRRVAMWLKKEPLLMIVFAHRRLAITPKSDLWGGYDHTFQR